MRSQTLFRVRLLAVVVLLGGCQLLTGGAGSTEDSPDASSTTSPVSACSLACVQGSHCEVQSQGPICVVSTSTGVDAGGIVTPPVTPPVTVTPPATACNLACIVGSHCVVQAQGPTCVPDATTIVIDAGPPAPVACNLLCVVGRHCKVTAQGPTCVLDKPAVLDASTPIPVETPCGATTCGADEMCCSASCGICEPKGGLCPAIACAPPDAALPKETCANTTCPTGTYCDDITGTAECKALPSCDTVKCSAGTSCELVQVQCIRAPCPPLPECVPTVPHVCNLACKVGTHCVVSSSGPSCEPDPNTGVSCGKKTCYGGQVCCNASCGICGSAGGACIALACAQTDVTP